jgi:adenylate kinase family enzyme
VRRIAVLGSGGSGKTWLAARIGEAVDLPVYGLDALFVRGGRDAMPIADVERRQRELVDGDRWVIEGNHLPTASIRLAAADTVVYLDRSTAACLGGLGRRWLPRRIRDEDRITARYVWHVATFRRRLRPEILRLLSSERTGSLIVLRTGRQMRAFLASLGRSADHR